MNDLYSPDTKEHIATETPADWMGSAGISAPSYNPQTEGCFWRGTAWEIVPSVPVINVPAVVSMRQARRALLGAGLLAQVNDAITAMPGVDGDAARIDWECATEVRRDSPLVIGLSAALGLTAAQLDTLFSTGATL